MNRNCTLTEGPCDCGAWHSKEEIEDLMAELSERNAENYGGLVFDEALEQDGNVVLLNKGRAVMVIPGTLDEILKLMEGK